MTSRRTAALELIHQTTKSEKDNLHRMFGVRDWSILLKYAYFYVSWFSHLRLFKRRSPQPRPETWGLGRGRSLVPMGLCLQTQVLFLLHAYLCRPERHARPRYTQGLDAGTVRPLGKWRGRNYSLSSPVFKTNVQIQIFNGCRS